VISAITKTSPIAWPRKNLGHHQDVPNKVARKWPQPLSRPPRKRCWPLSKPLQHYNSRTTSTIAKTSPQASLGSDLGHCWNLPCSSTWQRSQPLLRLVWHFFSGATLTIAKTASWTPPRSDLSHHQDLSYSSAWERFRPLSKSPWNSYLGMSFVIVETSQWALLESDLGHHQNLPTSSFSNRKDWLKVPSSSWVPSFFWALAWGRWSSSNQCRATSKLKRQSIKS